jgi:hypothetical protein
MLVAPVPAAFVFLHARETQWTSSIAIELDRAILLALAPPRLDHQDKNERDGDR